MVALSEIMMLTRHLETNRRKHLKEIVGQMKAFDSNGDVNWRCIWNWHFYICHHYRYDTYIERWNRCNCVCRHTGFAKIFDPVLKNCIWSVSMTSSATQPDNKREETGWETLPDSFTHTPPSAQQVAPRKENWQAIQFLYNLHPSFEHVKSSLNFWL